MRSIEETDLLKDEKSRSTSAAVADAAELRLTANSGCLNIIAN